MKRNRLFVKDYDYIAFRNVYTGVILYSDCDLVMHTILVKICDYDYFVNKINEYDYGNDYTIPVIDYNRLQPLD